MKVRLQSTKLSTKLYSVCKAISHVSPVWFTDEALKRQSKNKCQTYVKVPSLKNNFADWLKCLLSLGDFQKTIKESQFSLALSINEGNQVDYP